MQPKEEWRAVPGFEGSYEVSSMGRVRSLTRLIRKRLFQGTIRKLKLNKYGYLVCSLWSQRRRPKHVTVHRLVAQAFLPNPTDRPEVNHFDGDKTNNSVSNLEWSTSSENQRHAYRTGLQIGQKGSAHGTARLTEDEVLWIQAWLRSGFLDREVAEAFGIGTMTVGKIARGERWSHVSLKHFLGEEDPHGAVEDRIGFPSTAAGIGDRRRRPYAHNKRRSRAN